MPSELDPLLPHNEPAPEISGNGFRRIDTKNRSYVAQEVESGEHFGEDVRSHGGGASPLRITMALFTCVVGLGFLVSLLSSGGLARSWRPPASVPEDPHLDLSSRVDRILSQNPLFGIGYPQMNRPSVYST